MIIVEQIEIKNFRSFGNRKGETTKLIRVNPLNILSGSNDSGKSNILRGLNLFFNGYTDINQFFDSKVDFFKKEVSDDKDIKEELVTIKLWFFNEKNKGKNTNQPERVYLPEKFWVSRKWKKTSKYSQDTQTSNIEGNFQKEKRDAIHHFIDDDGNLKSSMKGSLQRQLTDFLTQIQFHYIPAIKDKEYFSHLYGELQQTLWKGQSSLVDKKKNEFQGEIQKETLILMDEFKNTLNQTNLKYEPVFQLPENLVDLFKTLQVQTGGIELSQRGDGVQAKLIPEILNYISIKERSLTSRTTRKGAQSKKYFIWGFEEPENSYEYKNAQMLANRFSETFVDNAQIFITTHSFNFLSIEGEKVSKYRVWQDSSISSSRISKIEQNKNGTYGTTDSTLSESYMLNDELGIFTLNSKLEKVFIETERIKNALESKITQIEQVNLILLVEDEYDQIYKVAWLKLNDIDFTVDNMDEKFLEYCHFNIFGLKSAGAVAGFLRSKNPAIFKEKKVVGLFDFDKEGSECFHHLKKEKFWSDGVSGEKITGHYRTRTDHPCCYAMLLPLPNRVEHLADLEYENFANYIVVENLLPKSFLVDNHYIKIKKAAGTEYLKIKDNCKDKLWKKATELQKQNFIDFLLIFDLFELLTSDN
jgi:AAA15 family ATPase/GTPase